MNEILIFDYYDLIDSDKISKSKKEIDDITSFFRAHFSVKYELGNPPILKIKKL